MEEAKGAGLLGASHGGNAAGKNAARRGLGRGAQLGDGEVAWT